MDDKLNKNNVLIAWEIGNDLYFFQTLENAILNFRNYCLDRKKVGFTIVILTMPPRDQVDLGEVNNNNYNINLKKANSILRSTYKEFADILVDISQDEAFQFYDTGYYAEDRVHHTDKARAYIADKIATELLNFYK
jgi:hypothetical protein